MRFLDEVLRLLFPSRCVNCRTATAPDSAVCDACLRSVTRHATLFCGTCSARYPVPRKFCHRETPFLFGAASDYHNDAARALVLALKFKGLRDAAGTLGNLLADYLGEVGVRLDGYAVVPVPLGAGRLRERGFNQAERIAAVVAERLGLPLADGVLSRIRETRPQSELRDAEARHGNVSDCFAARSSALAVPPSILLVDDVRTSGATLFAAAHALKRAGAKKVFAVVAAKA